MALLLTFILLPVLGLQRGGLLVCLRGERRGEKAGCQDESVAFVCCKESWDMKHDRSQGAEEMRQQAHGFKRENSVAHYLFLSHAQRADGNVDLAEDFSTSKHRTEGQEGTGGEGGDGGTIGRPGDGGKVRKYSSGALGGLKGNFSRQNVKDKHAARAPFPTGNFPPNFLKTCCSSAAE